MSVTIREIPLPESADHPDWVAFISLANEESRAIVGGNEWDETPEGVLAGAKARRESTITRRFLATDDGVPVGYARVAVDLRESPSEANIHAYVSPAARRSGLGRKLLDQLFAVIPDGVSRLSSWITTPIPGDDDPRWEAPSGVGAVLADDPGILLARDLGMRLGQVEEINRYDFANPAIAPDEALRLAQEKAGDDYEVLCFEGAVPEELIDDVAELYTVAARDVPEGELETDDVVWDAQKLREFVAEQTASNRFFVAVVRHRPTGRLVALNSLSSLVDRPEGAVDQHWTVVLPEHRGHGLAQLVKAANLIAVHQAVPEAPSIITYNATENQAMLAINRRLGFRPIGMVASFQRPVALGE